MSQSVLQLKCPCNNYPWGAKGKESRVARYMQQSHGAEFKIEDEKNYSEMWMGSYHTLPSDVFGSPENLPELLKSRTEELLGSKVAKKYGAVLPFLPKVLSIAKALPVQVHPVKDLAGKLHKQDSEKYTDDNHKPEIAVALTPFELFVGTKPPKTIAALLHGLTPLKPFQPGSTPSSFDSTTGPKFAREIWNKILASSEQTIEAAVKDLRNLKEFDFSSSELKSQTHILDLLPRLISQYGASDPGILVALICMNFTTLKPGQGIYIPAGGVHAYLSGDCIECMATSNNVINVGFCPPEGRDARELFDESLVIEHGAEEDEQPKVLLAEEWTKSGDGMTRQYAFPIEEFEMVVTDVKEGRTARVPGVEGPSVMVVAEGEGELVVGGKKVGELKEGLAFYVLPGVGVELKASPALVVYRAFKE